MKLYKQDPFGNALFLKKFLIRFIGAISHQRYQGFNKLHIEGSEIIRNRYRFFIGRIIATVISNILKLKVLRYPMWMQNFYKGIIRDYF